MMCELSTDEDRTCTRRKQCIQIACIGKHADVAGLGAVERRDVVNGGRVVALPQGLRAHERRDLAKRERAGALKKTVIGH